MRLRTIGLIVGLCIGAVTGYAHAAGTLIGHRGDETLRLLDKPCTTPILVEHIKEAEAALHQELLSAFKQGEYVEGKEAPIGVCYRKSVNPEGDYILLFEDGGSGHAPQDEFIEEAI